MILLHAWLINFFAYVSVIFVQLLWLICCYCDLSAVAVIYARLLSSTRSCFDRWGLACPLLLIRPLARFSSISPNHLYPQLGK